MMMATLLCRAMLIRGPDLSIVILEDITRSLEVGRSLSLRLFLRALVPKA